MEAESFSKDGNADATLGSTTTLEVEKPEGKHEAKALSSPSTPKDPRIWLVFVGICLASFCANLNATILTTVIPLIARDLSAVHDYIWFNAAYNIASAAIQPLFSHASNVFGRRPPMVLSLALFTLGSGLCGGAVNVAMMIAGRTIQGAGAGGIMLLQEVIVCDLLPLRERAKYFGVVLAFVTLGVVLGPIVGGAFVKHTTWRWVFYVNVPFGGLALVLAFLFLRLKAPATPWRDKFTRIDFVGNVLFIAATCSLLVGLITGGQVHPWSSWRVILPIVLGAVGWVIFYLYQLSPYCKEPTMPAILFSNRTSAMGFALVFLSCMLLDWVVYYLPYYFQTLQGSTALRSGVQVLPFNLFLVPAAGINGALLSKFGQYKPLHWVGFAIMSLAFGLFSTMDSSTSTVEWVFWQLFAAYGIGSLVTTTLPAVQAALPESEVASSAGLHAFLRAFGFVWAFTIPSLVFNNRIQSESRLIEDPQARSFLSNGAAYSQANSDWLRGLQGPTKEQVLHVYQLSMRSIWYAALAFSLLGFLLVFVEKRIKLRENLETDFGLDDKKAQGQQNGEA